MTDDILEQAVKGWARGAPAHTTELATDKAGFGHFWQRAAELLARLPAKPKRNAGEAAAAAEVLDLARASRTLFMRAHALKVYDSLTSDRNKFVRVDELCERAAREYPGLVPDARALERESRVNQGDKDGLEVDQGIFLSQVLADPVAGAHLCHAMLLPRPSTART
jgi:thioesterase DpgC